jgi:hypothetical protein
VASKWTDQPAGLILYKTALKLDDVLAALAVDAAATNRKVAGGG